MLNLIFFPYILVLFIMNAKKNSYFNKVCLSQLQQSKCRYVPKLRIEITDVPKSSSKHKNTGLNTMSIKYKKHRRYLSDVSYFETYDQQKGRTFKEDVVGDGVKQVLHFNVFNDERSHNQKVEGNAHPSQQDGRILSHYLRTLKTKNEKIHKKSINLSLLKYKLKGCLSRNLISDQHQEMPSSMHVQCCRGLEIAFKKLNTLKQIGYCDSKINEWVLNFCNSYKPHLKDILMKNTNKSTYNMNQCYKYEKNQKVVQEKIKYKIQKKKDVQVFIELQQIKLYGRYLEQILIQKNYIKIQEIQSSIIQKMSGTLLQKIKSKKFVFNRESQPEINNFTNQLNLFENKYGGFEEYSKINKVRFDRLNGAQNNIIQYYRNVLDEKTRKINRKQKEEAFHD